MGLQQSSSRRAGDLPTRDEPVRLESSITRSRVTHEDRHGQISRQLRTSEGSVAGIRQKLHDSLNAVAQHVSPLALSPNRKNSTVSSSLKVILKRTLHLPNSAIQSAALSGINRTTHCLFLAFDYYVLVFFGTDFF